MDYRSTAVRNLVNFARFKVDRMAEHRTFADEAMLLIGIKIITGVGDQIADPCDFIDLFAEMCLHQAIGSLGPKCAESCQLIGG